MLASPSPRCRLDCETNIFEVLFASLAVVGLGSTAASKKDLSSQGLILFLLYWFFHLCFFTDMVIMNKTLIAASAWTMALLLRPDTTLAFAPRKLAARDMVRTQRLEAKPRRLEENVEGALYVNDRVS